MKGSLWRYLLQEGEGESIDSGANSTSYEHPEAFDARVFWGVNGFIFTMILGMCVWCWCFGGKDYLTDWTSRRAESDRRWQERVRDRHERRMAARRSTPAKRSARLKRSFVRHKVQMIVKEGDIVEGDDANQRYKNQREQEELQKTQTSQTNEESDSTEESCCTPPHGEENGTGTDNVEALEEGTLPPNTGFQSRVPAIEAPSPTEPSSTDAAMEEGVVAPAASDETSTSATNTNIYPLPSSDDDDNMFAESTGYLVLRPGDTPQPPPNPRMVPNCCAVCLGDYEIGDKVVWSCNPECSHAFHEDCIMEWLLKIQDGGTPCPCCRQEFTSWEKDRQERKIKWAADHAFNATAVSLR